MAMVMVQGFSSNTLAPLFSLSWQLLEGEVLPPQHGSVIYTFPVVYRQHLYFCSGQDERETFMQCPSRFLKQPSPKPVVPIKMAIIGPPKSGKTGCEYRTQVGVDFLVFVLLYYKNEKEQVTE